MYLFCRISKSKNPQSQKYYCGYDNYLIIDYFPKPFLFRYEIISLVSLAFTYRPSCTVAFFQIA